MLWTGALGLVGCQAVRGQPSARELFGPEIREVAFEFDYAEGAEPYVSEIPDYQGFWELFSTNANRLFEGTNKVLIIPFQLEDMEAIGTVDTKAFSVGDIVSLASSHRDLESTKSRATFYGLWLDGYYDAGNGPETGILGVSLGDTRITAFFKPAIASTSEASPLVAHFVEQVTLIHEFAHASGLVNNGVPMATDHEDIDHATHCTNPACAMNHVAEAAADAKQFVTQYVTAQDTIVFGSECLDDVDAFIGEVN